VLTDPTTAAELPARAAITEVIHRYCRGMDRMDRELTLSCWHPGGTDDHAPLYSGSAEGFVEWLWPVHTSMVCTRHVVSNTLIEVNGDKAAAETYWTVTLRIANDDGLYDIQGGGRYVDNFECIGGVWAIRHRQSLHDWDRVDRVSATMQDSPGMSLLEPNNPEVAAKTSARDRSDYSYQVLDRR
jgi:hypothetical protein